MILRASPEALELEIKDLKFINEASFKVSIALQQINSVQFYAYLYMASAQAQRRTSYRLNKLETFPKIPSFALREPPKYTMKSAMATRSASGSLIGKK